jgi:hypothetical protein
VAYPKDASNQAVWLFWLFWLWDRGNRHTQQGSSRASHICYVYRMYVRTYMLCAYMYTHTRTFHNQAKAHSAEL